MPDTESGVADVDEPAEVLQSASAAKPFLPLRRSAMDSLARREHSYVELQRKLRLKYPDAPHDEIDFQLGRLRDQGLQSDARFVESYVRYRKSRGFAYLHIRSDLLGRGVPQSLIESNLFEDDDDWLPMAEALVQKRLLGQSDFVFWQQATSQASPVSGVPWFPSTRYAQGAGCKVYALVLQSIPLLEVI